MVVMIDGHRGQSGETSKGQNDPVRHAFNIWEMDNNTGRTEHVSCAVGYGEKLFSRQNHKANASDINN
jgi:hypothetical protein